MSCNWKTTNRKQKKKEKEFKKCTRLFAFAYTRTEVTSLFSRKSNRRQTTSTLLRGA